MAAISSVCAFQKNPSMLDYPGCMSALFFTSGCNFRCGYCHNAALLAGAKGGLPYERLERACEKFREDWVDAAVITGGEPTLSPDLPILIGLFRSAGFRVKLDTNGSKPDAIARVLRDVDYVAMDVKCRLENYPRVAGFNDPDAIRRSIALVRDGARDYEFRTTIVESLHTDEELHAIGEAVRGARRCVVQPFVPRDDLRDETYRRMPRARDERVREAAAILRGYADEVVCRA